MDSYNSQTRLLPVMTALAPLTIGLGALTWGNVPLGLVSLITATGVHVWVMRRVRDRGQVVQQRLWKKWGGGLSPSAVALRWPAENEERSEKSHARLHRQVTAATGVRLPTRLEEQNDPAAADDSYREAVEVLLEKTRDHAQHPRVWAELRSYAHARNLYAVRPWGLTIASTVLLVAGLLLLAHQSEVLTVFAPERLIVAATVALAWCLLWSVGVTETYVRRDADRYSQALLGSAAALGK